MSTFSSTTQVADEDEEMDELSDEEIEQYFLRLTVGDMDDTEQGRETKLHQLLKRLLGGSSLGPIPEALSPDPNKKREVLDLCTGSGQWPMEMAQDFLHVSVLGLDLVPITPPIDLPENVKFEIHDINLPTRFLPGSIDVIHARSISLTVRDYRTIINEAARLLRPGGVLFSGEWRRYTAFDPTNYRHMTPHSDAPGLTHFFERLNDALLHRRGIRSVEHEIPQLITESGFFKEVIADSAFIPIGDYHDELPLKQMGRIYRDCMKKFMEASRRLMLEAGYTNAQLDIIFSDAWQDMKYVNGMGGIYHTVTAVKV
ncbi:hypothetical protein V5O48_017802 [Marasmius crinis-equi]|uniref:Methyltransferase domain-containing protein n=1 Tax=Marasmius crinis-equi TaxID=585013 RepID=A0ABR3EMZ3_9AGAR